VVEDIVAADFAVGYVCAFVVALGCCSVGLRQNFESCAVSSFGLD